MVDGRFHAGEVSSYKLKQRGITDREWQHSMLKFIKKARVPIVPVYFEGHNSIQFNVLGFIHPVLRTLKLPSELYNKERKSIRVRIGTPVLVDEQDEFKDISDFGRFLRMKTYILGLNGTPENITYRRRLHPAEQIMDATPENRILKEIEQLKDENLLFRVKEKFVFCAPPVKIPNIL